MRKATLKDPQAPYSAWGHPNSHGRFPPKAKAQPLAPPASSVIYYCVMYLTGFFIMVHSPEFLSYMQLQNASQFSSSMLGLSARK